ncbi:hypothetical protein MP228_012168 [Amoeboaphelidium protococcarum]|nr:hypothetical protein MP228_012168 [Amoeboaphelidium protococcarum]
MRSIYDNSDGLDTSMDLISEECCELLAKLDRSDQQQPSSEHRMFQIRSQSRIFDIAIKETSLAEADLGSLTWNSSLLFIKLILLSAIHVPQTIRSVLELGCGTGLSGIFLSMYAMKAALNLTSVLLTDYHEGVLKTAQSNVSINAAISSLVDVHKLDWRNFEEFSRDGFDLIIGTDLVYDMEAALALPKVLKHITVPGTQIILLLPQRRNFEREISAFQDGMKNLTSMVGHQTIIRDNSIFTVYFNFNMARRYDSRTTIFSPEGRLYQVEYAMEAISHAGTALGVLCQDGVILAAEKKVTSKLLDDQVRSTEKVYPINDNITVAVAGITADATILIQHARLDAQKHLMMYGEQVPVEQLVEKMCDLKQSYTQYGGLRPFGVSFLWAGWDDTYRLKDLRSTAIDSAEQEGGSKSGFQLYCSDPSGNYAGWKAHCIGGNWASAQSILKQDYRDDLTLFGDGKPVVQEPKQQQGSSSSSASATTSTPADQPSVKSGIELVLKCLSKTIESTSLNSEKLEIAIVGRKQLKDGSSTVYTKVYEPEDVDAILKHYGYVKPEQQQEA